MLNNYKWHFDELTYFLDHRGLSIVSHRLKIQKINVYTDAI